MGNIKAFFLGLLGLVALDAQAENLETILETQAAQNAKKDKIVQMPLQRVFLKYHFDNGSTVALNADYRAINNGHTDNTVQLGYSAAIDTAKENSLSVGTDVTAQGKPDEKSKVTTDAWVSKTVGQLDLFGEFGRGVQKEEPIKDWVYVSATHPNMTSQTFFAMDGTITNNPDVDIYSILSANKGPLYVCVGDAHNENDNLFVAVGTPGAEDVGNFTFGRYDPETHKFSFKSRTNVGSLDQKWYTSSNFDVGNSETVIGGFFPIHFSKAVRGNYELIIIGSGQDRIETLETQIGTQLTPTTHVSVGLSDVTTPHTKGTVGAYQKVSIAGIEGYVEASFNAGTQTGAAYLVLKKSF